MIDFTWQRFRPFVQSLVLGAVMCYPVCGEALAQQNLVQQNAVAVPPVALQAPAVPVQTQEASRPVLVISNSPVPKSVLKKAYGYPAQGREITPSQVVGSAYYKPTETMVSRKLRDLRSELAILQDKVILLSKALAGLQRKNESHAAAYFAAVATINTQLQVGTTPGNPRLLERFSTAESSLEFLANHLAEFNELSIDSSKVATEASFLLDSARATYGLSGAVEEDHVQLAEIEDKINAMIVLVERVLNTVSDDISRVSNYLTSERDNLRTLSLAVANGTLYGQSLADRPFSGVRNLRPVAAPSAPPAQAYQQQPQAYQQQQSAYQQQPVYQQQRAYTQPVYPQQVAYAAPQPAALPVPVYEERSVAALPVPQPAVESVPVEQDLVMAEQRMQESLSENLPSVNDESMMTLPMSFEEEDDMVEEEAFEEVAQDMVAQPQAVPVDAAPEVPEQRPIVKIRFDRTNVQFEQPLYMAVNQVLDRYPDASFNVVALHSSLGGAAQTAIESTRSRRNAQKIIRTLSQIGVGGDKIGVSYDQSAEIDANEVHLYIY